MKPIASLFNTVLVLIQLFAQAQSYDAQEIELQQKYFNLRDHFHKEHVLVGSGYKNFDLRINNEIKTYKVGTSIPYERHYITNSISECPGTGGSGNYSTSDFELFTGDGTIKIGWYLIYLSTEYKLLFDDGKDTKETLNEIYYLLNAIERLDAFSEWDMDNNKPMKLDGFFVRDDCPYIFFT